jgi:hypothetical protein
LRCLIAIGNLWNFVNFIEFFPVMYGLWKLN